MNWNKLNPHPDIDCRSEMSLFLRVWRVFEAVGTRLLPQLDSSVQKLHIHKLLEPFMNENSPVTFLLLAAPVPLEKQLSPPYFPLLSPLRALFLPFTFASGQFSINPSPFPFFVSPCQTSRCLGNLKLQLLSTPQSLPLPSFLPLSLLLSLSLQGEMQLDVFINWNHP